MPSREVDPEAPWDDELPIPPELMLSRAPCGSCGKQDVLIPDWSLVGGGDLVGQWMVRNRSFVDQIAVQGNTCSNCVKLIYEKNRLAAVDGSTSDGSTLLHYAARSDNFRMLYHFICLVREKHSRGDAAKVIRKLNGRRETALHEAIRLENRCMVGLLMRADRHLAKYPIPDPAHPNDTSPLYLAVSLTDDHMAEVLYHESRGCLSYCGPNGQNALHAAALHAPDMVEMLLGWKKDLRDKTDKQGRIPLHYLAMAGFRPNTMQRHATCLLLGNVKQSSACQQDNEGLSPLHIAAMMDSKVIFRILVSECPACIGLRDNRGRTFLHIAVQKKTFYLVSYACQEPIFAPIWNARDNDGNTALHIAVKVGELSIFCALLKNREVQLSLRNDGNETPLDLANCEDRPVFLYILNSDDMIYWTLVRAGGLGGSIPLEMSKPMDEKNKKEDEEDSEDKHDENKKTEKEDKEKKDSDQMNDSTRTLGLASVLIASVTFTSTFTVPTAVKAGDHSNSGTPTLLRTWYYKAFMLANISAFISALIATLGLMFSGISMVELHVRQKHFQRSAYFTTNAFCYWIVAFSMGLILMLDPGIADSPISYVVFLTSSVPLLLWPSCEFLKQTVLTSRPLYARKGLKFVCKFIMWRIFLIVLIQLWPIIITIIAATL